jgi:hypothetical protein
MSIFDLDQVAYANRNGLTVGRPVEKRAISENLSLPCHGPVTEQAMENERGTWRTEAGSIGNFTCPWKPGEVDYLSTETV